MKLICFPHAGGMSANYRGLKHTLEKNIPGLSVDVFEYSGRGRRAREAPYPDLYHASVRIADEIKNDLQDDVCCFFGHSMGALIAVEVVYRLQEMGAPGPDLVFISGQDAPLNKNLHHSELPGNMFWDYIISLGAVDRQSLSDQMYRETVEKIVRNDLRIAESYHPTEGRLTVDLDVLYGNLDPEINANFLEKWKTITTGSVRYRCFDGDHFYLLNDSEPLIRYISERLDG